MTCTGLASSIQFISFVSFHLDGAFARGEVMPVPSVSSGNRARWTGKPPTFFCHDPPVTLAGGGET